MAELSVLELRLTVVRGLEVVHEVLLAIWCSRRTRKPRPHVTRLRMIEKLRARGDIPASLAHRLKAMLLACDRLLSGACDNLGPTSLAEMAGLLVELRLILKSREDEAVEPATEDGHTPPPPARDSPPPRGLALFVAKRSAIALREPGA